MIDLNKLKIDSHRIFIERVLNGAKLNADHLKHCASELVEAVQARSKAQLTTADEKDFVDFTHELADVIICVLNECYVSDVDIEKAILEVIAINQLRAEKRGDKL